jgi:hypothetical protein
MLAKAAFLAMAASALTMGCLDPSTPSSPVVSETQPSTDVEADDSDTDPQAFAAYHELDDYGTWSDDTNYGSVWTPYDVAFVPYVTAGHWVSVATNNGVTAAKPIWVANSTWGTVTTHHGRWVATPSVATSTGSSSGNRWRWIPPTRVIGRNVVAQTAIAPTVDGSAAGGTSQTRTVDGFAAGGTSQTRTVVVVPASLTTDTAKPSIPTARPIQPALDVSEWARQGQAESQEVHVAPSRESHEAVVAASENTERADRVERAEDVAPRDLRMASNGVHGESGGRVESGGTHGGGGYPSRGSHTSGGGYAGHGGRGR